MKQTSLMWLMKRIKNRLFALVLMTLVHAGQAFLSVLFVLATRSVIDSAVMKDSSSFYSSCFKQLLIILGILVCLSVFRHMKERLSAELDRDLKKSLLHTLLHGEYVQVCAYHSAELINRLNHDVKTVIDGLLTILPSACGMCTRLMAAVGVLASLDLRFTLMILCLGVLMIGLTGLLRGRLKELHKKVSEQDGIVSGLLQEAIEKLLVIQAMDVSDEVERRADVLLNERYRMQLRRKNVSLVANTSVTLVSYGAAFVSLMWCSAKVLAGSMSFGTLTAVTQLVSQLQSPFVGLSGVYPKYIAMLASIERLMELEEIEDEGMALDADDYDEMRGLSAQGLCFSYHRDNDEQVIFKDAEFYIPKGSFAVITGSSGIGKSTLLKLMLGIFPVSKGSLLAETSMGNTCLNRSTRKLFAYVPQGNLLFSGTILENLLIVRPEASKEEISLAVHVSGMDEYLDELAMGLDTMLKENGAGLSEGQAQRLAIARAVLSGAKVLLLDECTSALDHETEKLVLTRLKSLSDRTVIAVTHRPYALELCDIQLEIEDGSIQCV